MAIAAVVAEAAMAWQPRGPFAVDHPVLYPGQMRLAAPHAAERSVKVLGVQRALPPHPAQPALLIPKAADSGLLHPHQLRPELLEHLCFNTTDTNEQSQCITNKVFN